MSTWPSSRVCSIGLARRSIVGITQPPRCTAETGTPVFSTDALWSSWRVKLGCHSCERGSTMARIISFVCTLIALWPSSAAQTEKRVALVIGNSAYQNTGELRNPSNDATDMTAALRRLGFEVTDGRDLDKRAMER